MSEANRLRREANGGNKVRQ